METPPSPLAAELDAMRARVDAKLDEILRSDEPREARLVEAMRYSVLSGGKRFRPILCLASFEAAGGRGDGALPVAAALELIHAYSLVHDDLPCMDDDDVRRGRPTAHRVFGEGLAVLSGDALLTLAFEVISGFPQDPGLAAGCRPEVLRKVARAAGVHGMIGGQVADLEAADGGADAGMIEYVLSRKTGALIEAAVWAGARLGTDDPGLLERFAGFGEKTGFAFQIVDDILDHAGRPDEAASYVRCHGLDRARETAATLIGRAKEDLAALGPRGRLLTMLADFVVARAY